MSASRTPTPTNESSDECSTLQLWKSVFQSSKEVVMWGMKDGIKGGCNGSGGELEICCIGVAGCCCVVCKGAVIVSMLAGTAVATPFVASYDTGGKCYDLVADHGFFGHAVSSQVEGAPPYMEMDSIEGKPSLK